MSERYSIYGLSCYSESRALPAPEQSGRVEGTREFIISGAPCILAYVVTDEALQVLRVLHGSQHWPDDVP